MRPSVRAAFVRFTAPMEGVCTWMYLDVRGLVTTAIGNLIDTASAALALPWQRPDGTPASHSEIVSEWSKVKGRQDLKLRGGGAYKAITMLRLDDAGVQQVVTTTLDRMDRQLAARFPEYEEWPADAQLATLSMAWAAGPAFRFPKLEAALRIRDFLVAAVECHLNEEGNPGVKPRNRANVVLYRNASVAVDKRLDHGRLWWPRDIWETPLGDTEDTVDEEITPVRAVSLVDFAKVTRLPDTNPFDGEPGNDDGSPDAA